MMIVCTTGMKVIRKTLEVAQVEAEDQQEQEVHKTLIAEEVTEVKAEEVEVLEAQASIKEVKSEEVPEVDVREPPEIGAFPEKNWKTSCLKSKRCCRHWRTESEEEMKKFLN